jgi:F-type H+-transporting ATPase subunit b
MGGIASLGISLPTLIAQIVNFIILFVLLYLVAYRPIMRMFDERSRKIKDSLEQAEYIKEQAARAEEAAEKRIQAASQEGQEMVTRAVRTGEELRQKAEQEARQEAEALISRARAEIQRERDEAIDEVRKAFADLTIRAAEKVIDRSLDKEAHREIIAKVLEESTSTTLKKGEK